MLLGLCLTAAGLAVRYAADWHLPVAIVDDIITSDRYGAIRLARPLPGFQNLAVVYADTQKYPADRLAHRLAEAGDAAAVIDTGRALQSLTAAGCLNADRIMEPVGILSDWAKAAKDNHSVLAGIEAGGLLPLLAALTDAGGATDNLSIGFTVNLPAGLTLCAPLTTVPDQGGRRLLAPPLPLKGAWLAAWTDQPAPDTGVFVRGLTGAQIIIEPYDTPLDSVAVNEIAALKKRTGSGRQSAWPVVEVPAKTDNETVTIFYSGDGGWRDLDRAVAGQMAERGYPVVGVDTLRDFWSKKTPAQTANELSAMMAYYRTAWKAKKFILAGYSFGADILPAVYNLLPETDRDNVPLLVLLALGENADFEIHVSGWIGKSGDGLPIMPELNRIPANKILCIFGQEEKADSVCARLTTPGAHLLELPGGHHFDQDYAKLATRIIDMYQRIGLTGRN